MNHTHHLTSWIHSSHADSHGALYQLEHLFTNKAFWAAIGIISLILGFIIMLAWLAPPMKGNYTPMPMVPYYL